MVRSTGLPDAESAARAEVSTEEAEAPQGHAVLAAQESPADATSPHGGTGHGSADDADPVEVIGRSFEGLSVDEFEAEFGLADAPESASVERATQDCRVAGDDGRTSAGLASAAAPGALGEPDYDPVASSLAPMAVSLSVSGSSAAPSLVPTSSARTDTEFAAGERSPVAGKHGAAAAQSTTGALLLPPPQTVSLGRQFGIGAGAGLLAVLLLMFLQGGLGLFTTRHDPQTAAATEQAVGEEAAATETFSEAEWEQSAAWDEELPAEDELASEHTVPAGDARRRSARRSRWARARKAAARSGPRGLGSKARFPEMSAAEERRHAEQLRQQGAGP